LFGLVLKKMLRFSAHPRALKPSRPVVQQHPYCQFNLTPPTYKQDGEASLAGEAARLP